MSDPDPFIPRTVSADWKDMEESIYALMARKPIEYLFMLEDGRYVVCSSTEINLYQRSISDTGECTFVERQSPIAWRFAKAW